MPTVKPVWRRQARQVRTPGRVAMRKGSPTTPQLGQAKPSAPACLFQIGGAGGVVGEKPLELGERFREAEVGAIENATLLSASDTLALRAVCVNRTIMLSEGS